MPFKKGTVDDGPSKPHQMRNRLLKRKREVEDVESLNQAVANLDQDPTTPLETFVQLPLSQASKSGLEASHFKQLTPIQARGIPISLKGRDVLGSARTGSGKTLAFLVPVLENLYRQRWTEHDGLGALILSPTRELAIQIFDVLRKIGRHHTFSAGLVIGGKSLQEEKDRLGRMNILVATPGRMLQHMDQNAELDIGNLQMLVLDEADRIMDMGFQTTVDAIVDHLPKNRQTLLFSATQTKKVSDLARLSLQNPEFVSVQEDTDAATPSQLAQNYVVTPLPQKLDTLWSFLRSNTKKKILVFLSSGKQVRFVYEAFRRLQPGVPLLHLHGRQKQVARLDITTRFSTSKHACLFSTDVAARGLDFPAVDWVVQVDCPEDADTYIHRVGRTARYNSSGSAVLFLDPSEQEGMLEALGKKQVTGVEEIRVRQKKMQNTIQNQLQNMCLEDPELKYLGQKAFISYVRSIYIQKDKSIFDVRKLELDTFATSLGLPGAPRVRFVKGEDAKRIKNMPRALAAMERDEVSGEDEVGDIVDEVNPSTQGNQRSEKPVRTKYDRMFERRNQDVLADHYARIVNDGPIDEGSDVENADTEEDDDIVVVKRRYDLDVDPATTISQDLHQAHSTVESGSVADTASSTTLRPASPMATQPTPKTIYFSSRQDAIPLVVDSKRRANLLKSKKGLLKYQPANTHLVFDASDPEDNEGREKVYYEKEHTFTARGAAAEQRAKFLETEKDKAAEADLVDRELAKEKRQMKKIRRKEREREMHEADDDDVSDGNEDGVQLAPYDENNNEDENRGERNDRTPPSGDDISKMKRRRKWFETASSDDDNGDDNTGNLGETNQLRERQKKKNKSSKHHRNAGLVGEEPPQTLEDLEALAVGLLKTR